MKYKSPVSGLIVTAGVEPAYTCGAERLCRITITRTQQAYYKTR
ncbi:hypothetical protein [Gilliamella sp. Fer4-1]|nr:hypothetical protein [Gilliamella apicola]